MIKEKIGYLKIDQLGKLNQKKAINKHIGTKRLAP